MKNWLQLQIIDKWNGVIVRYVEQQKHNLLNLLKVEVY